MDLTTDFKKIIKVNTESSIESLNKIYISVNREDNYLFYKEINQYYTLLKSWFTMLQKKYDEDFDLLLDNILINYCSLMHCVTLCDLKLINFLFRNTIESFLRFLLLDIENRDIERMFSELSSESIGCEKELIQMYSSQMRQIYTDNCFYIHAQPSKMIKDFNTLLDYKNNIDNPNLELYNLRIKFSNLNVAILSLLRIKYAERYIYMKDNIKSMHDEILPLQENIRYNEYLKVIKNNSVGSEA
nr:hypothetical protein [Clostridioides sp.]